MKRILSFVLAVSVCGSLSLGLVGCDTKKTESDSGVNEKMVSGGEEVNQLLAKDMPKLELANKEIVWLCWDKSWNYDAGTTEGDLFNKAYGATVKTETCSYDDRYSTLASRVSSGNSPDLFPYEGDNYPSGVISNMYAPIDDYLDLNQDCWSNTKEMMEKFVVSGKHYVVIPHSYTGDFLVYNRDVMEENGFEDPWALYKAGKWDWNKMKEMLVAFCDPDNDKYGIGGWWPEYSMVATTGTPFVGLEDGKLVNNLKSSNVSRAMNFLYEINQQGLNYPWEKFDWSKKNINYVAEGKTLFYATGEYDLKGTFCSADKAAYCENVFVCPFPKDPEADKYYQHYGVDAHMMVVGAKNPEGVAAWQYVRLYSSSTAEAEALSRQKAKENYGYSEELIDALEGLKDPTAFEPVYDFRRGVSAELTGTSDEAGIIVEIERCTFKMGKTWTETLETNYSAVDAAVTQANNSLATK